MPFGAGNSPAGRGPFGFGTPDTVPPIGGKVFRDPSTGESLHCARIDSAKGDYVFDEHGRVLGMTQGQQNVYLAMKTELGTSAQTGLGQNLKELKVIGANFEKEVEQRIRRALQPSIDGGLIERVVVQVSNDRSRVYAKVTWFDLTLQRELSQEI